MNHSAKITYKFIVDLEELRRQLYVYRSSHIITQQVRDLLSFALKDIDAAKEEMEQQSEELARSRQAVEAERRRYMELFEYAPDPYLVTNGAGIIKEANLSAVAMLGEEGGSLVASPILSFVEEEDVETFATLIYELQKGRPVRDYEVRLKGRGGASFFTSISVNPNFSSEGKIGVFRWFIRDISRFRQKKEKGSSDSSPPGAEEAIRQSEEKFRMIFDKSPLGILHFDQHSTISACNESYAEIVGLPKSLIVGLNLLNSLKNEGMRTSIYRCLAGECVHYEGRYRFTKGGKISYLKGTLAPVFGYRGKVMGGIGIIEDISQRKQTEGVLRRSESELRSLSGKLLTGQEDERKKIASALHDGISQSLAAIKFNIEDILKKADSKDSSSIAGSLELLIPRIQNMIAETRRIYMGLRPSVLDDLGVIAAINWLLRDFRELYPSHYVEEEIDVEESEIPKQLKLVIFRIIQEALNNIANHSRAELVSLSLVKQEKTIDLNIEDNGVGFELNSVLSPEGHNRGFGLGLTSMKERVRLSGGTFSIESSEGEGVAIRVSWLLDRVTMRDLR